MGKAVVEGVGKLVLVVLPVVRLVVMVAMAAMADSVAIVVTTAMKFMLYGKLLRKMYTVSQIPCNRRRPVVVQRYGGIIFHKERAFVR